MKFVSFQSVFIRVHPWLKCAFRLKTAARSLTLRAVLQLQNIPSQEQARTELMELLRSQSIFRGDFTLASGAKSTYYFDCRLTTLDPKGAWLVGQLIHEIIRREEAARKIRIGAIGGLTMGADPVALATAMFSYVAQEGAPLQTFSVRKTPKGHGQTKLIEANFRKDATAGV